MMVEEPFRLPMVLPVALIKPSVVPIATAINADEAVVVEMASDVWLMLEIMLFWITVAGALVLTLAASMPRN
jgi:hypothetical protein